LAGREQKLTMFSAYYKDLRKKKTSPKYWDSTEKITRKIDKVQNYYLNFSIYFH